MVINNVHPGGCDYSFWLNYKPAWLIIHYETDNFGKFEHLKESAVKYSKIRLARLKSFFENKAEKTLDDGSTYLHIVSRWGYTELVTFLIQRGAAVNKQNNAGWTPLHCAVLGGKNNTKTIELLLENLAEPELQTLDKKIVVQIAEDNLSKEESSQLANLILVGRRDPKTGRTLLHNSVSLRQLSLTEKLLKMQANPMAVDKQGKTAIQVAYEGAHMQPSQSRRKIMVMVSRAAEEQIAHEENNESKQNDKDQ